MTSCFLQIGFVLKPDCAEFDLNVKSKNICFNLCFLLRAECIVAPHIATSELWGPCFNACLCQISVGEER